MSPTACPPRPAPPFVTGDARTGARLREARRAAGLTVEQLAALERADAYLITFNGSTIPHAIHLVLNHDSGVGTTWVVNPRGDLKNVVWSDTGSAITVMLTPANGLTLQQMIHFKFYVAGGLTGLTVASLKAYDINGNLIPGVTTNIQ